jgi:hypothetical protein
MPQPLGSCFVLAMLQSVCNHSLYPCDHREEAKRTSPPMEHADEHPGHNEAPGPDEGHDEASTPSDAQALTQARPRPVGQAQAPAPAFAMGADRARSYLSTIHTLKGHDTTDADKGHALAGLRTHLDRLTCDDPAGLIEVLAGQSLVLEHLSLTFFERAAKLATIKPEAAVALAKIALSSQAGFVRCHGAIAALRKQKAQGLGLDD